MRGTTRGLLLWMTVLTAGALGGCAQVLGLDEPSLAGPACADSGDADGDGVCDPDDACPGDDAADGDDDGTPDGCDACAGADDALDGDGDGVPDGCDACPLDDPDDRDDDGICDSADVCLGGDDALDGDGDGVPDGCDICAGADDALDGDGDGAPDGCDVCPTGLCASCADVLAEQPAAPDGMYPIDPDGQGPADPLDVFCDMTTDGGGWTRLVHWDREGDPAVHTLASLQAQMIDEIAEAGDPAVSPMTEVIERADHVHWSDFDGTADALSFRRDIVIPNGGELLLDIHYEGLSMENSGIWLHAIAAGLPVNLHCYSTADAVPNYAPEERALIPYACPVTTPNQLIVAGVEQRALAAPVSAFVLRSMHHDTDFDRSNLFRLTVLVR